MTLADHARDLIDYTCWADDRVLAAAAGLSDEEFAKVRGPLAHALETQRFWLSNWTSTQFVERAPETYEDLRSLYDESHGALRACFIDLDDDGWRRAEPWWKRWGHEATMPLGETLFQVVNHSTQHRSEAALLLTEMGHSPGELDFLVFKPETAELG